MQLITSISLNYKQCVNLFIRFGITSATLVLLVVFLSKISPIDSGLSRVGDQFSDISYQAKNVSLKHGFGFSLLTNNLVLQDIKLAMPATFELATAAMLFAILIGVPLGILAAVNKDKLLDHILRMLCLLGNSVSIFWLSLMAMLLFYAKLQLFPAPGRVDIAFLDEIAQPRFLLISSILDGNWPLFKDALAHIMLPALVLGYYSLANISRMTRLFVLQELQQEYVITCKLKGMPFNQILRRHILPNTAIKLITVILLSYASLLEGSTFVENIFMWPGIGLYLTQSIMVNDLNAILACTIVIALIFITANFICDALYKFLDPRVANV